MQPSLVTLCASASLIQNQMLSLQTCRQILRQSTNNFNKYCQNSVFNFLSRLWDKRRSRDVDCMIDIDGCCFFFFRIESSLLTYSSSLPHFVSTPNFLTIFLVVTGALLVLVNLIKMVKRCVFKSQPRGGKAVSSSSSVLPPLRQEAL